jgi:hypothetical protein
MPSNRVKLSVCALVSLFAGYSEATCVNWENTSIPESTPTSNHTILPDGTLTATATGLMWKRCLEGQTLVDGICEGTLIIHNWADALVAAEAVTFAGHSDWRLANPKELLTIFEDRCAYPALNADLFPIYDFFASWTATPVDGLLQDIYFDVWVMDNDGGMGPRGRGSFLPMLLVRDLP